MYANNIHVDRGRDRFLLTGVACWLIMATAIALERACTFPVTLTTLELELEEPVAMFVLISKS